MAFTTLVLFQMFNVFNNRSPTRTAFTRAYRNPLLWGAVLLSLLLQLAVVYLAPLQRAFRTMPLSAGDWLVAIGVGATVLLSVEAAKLLVRARAAAPEGRRVAIEAPEEA
jgi:Ca2+-transporting ATPase